MKVKQFKDESLSHFSYALLSDNKIAIIDPARDPKPYYDFAESENANIVAVLETHPHADFVSSHLQIHNETGAKIYVSSQLGAGYKHEEFNEGKEIQIGDVTIQSIFTPGHSPDSLSYHAFENDNHVLFSGDTLFVGNVGRPDLREDDNDNDSKREELASKMYETIQNKFNDLPDHTVVYPTHGAGSLCGSNMGSAESTTMGAERQSNWAFKTPNKDEFIKKLLDEQPFIPAYFSFNVKLNQKGGSPIEKAIYNIPFRFNIDSIDDDILIVDVRDEADYKNNHFPNSVNIMARSETDKFETWLGSTVKPNEKFHLLIPNIQMRENLLKRTAKIGYENQVVSVVTMGKNSAIKTPDFNKSNFSENKDAYTIIDVRNESEVNETGKIFDSAINIPLYELRNRMDEVPTNKPIAVHCAGGYRSAVASSLLSLQISSQKIYDISEDINEFK